MGREEIDIDSAGVYIGISMEDFGVRLPKQKDSDEDGDGEDDGEDAPQSNETEAAKRAPRKKRRGP